MKRIPIILICLFLVGCATKLIVIERDTKGTVRTIEAEDYSIKTPTLTAVPSRWLTPNFVAEVFKGVIGWQSIIPAVECSPVVTDGKRILYDLGTLPNGAFTVKALARNLWGSSAYTAPLADTKQLPSSPLPLRITP